MKRRRLEIPSQSREVKAWFFEEPGPSIIREIKAFVAKTGKPYLWRGHTHTKPPVGGRVVYLEEFCLPEDCQTDEDRWSPCPCCHDDLPWFKGTDKKKAKIAWFPDEGVIRLIGNDCFAALNHEGHQEALRELQKRQKRLKHQRYLINNIGLVPIALAAIDQNAEVAVVLDEFRKDLQSKLAVFPQLRLRERTREGRLNVTDVYVKTTVTRDKKEVRKTIYDEKIYANIRGYRILEPDRPLVAPKLEKAYKLLREIPAGVRVDRLDDRDLVVISRNFARGIVLARDATEEIDALRRFVSVETIKTLSAWGAHPSSPVKLHVERVDDRLLIGPSKSQKISVRLPLTIDEPLAEIPVPGTGESLDAINNEAA